MWLFYRENCHFAQGEGKCLLRSWLTCRPCSMYVPNLPGRSTGDHIALVLGRNAGTYTRVALIVAAISLLISVFALVDNHEEEQAKPAPGPAQQGPDSSSSDTHNRPRVKVANSQPKTTDSDAKPLRSNGSNSSATLQRQGSVGTGLDLWVGPAYLATWGVAPGYRMRAFQAPAVAVGLYTD